MKLILSSDWHLIWDRPVGRIDNFLKAQERKLEFIFQLSHKLDGRMAALILQAGDIFDTERSWRLLAFLQGLINKYKPDISAIMGQHDRYAYSHAAEPSTALGAMFASRMIHRIPNEGIDFGNCKIYGCSVGEEIPKVKDKVTPAILVIHRQIVKEKLWTTQKDFTYANEFVKQHSDFAFILCGDAHQKFIAPMICNTGPLMRLDATEEMFTHKPCVFIFDTDELKIIDEVELPHEPADKVLSREHLEKANARKQMRNEMMDRFVDNVNNAEIVHGVQFEDNLNELLAEEKDDGVKDIITAVRRGELCKTH